MRRVEFVLKSISIDQFDAYPDVSVNYDQVKLTPGVGYEVERISRTITVAFKVLFESENKTFIVLQVSCVYQIAHEVFQNFPVKSEHILNVRKDLISHLTLLTVGTARGILHAKLLSTPFLHFVLPLLDVSDLEISPVDMSVIPVM